VVKKQEIGSAEWKEVELKEMLEVFEKLEKEHPKEVYSLDNLRECHFIGSMVNELKTSLEHRNTRKTNVGINHFSIKI